MRERDGRLAERKFVPVVLMNIATEVWPTSKMLDINISVAMIWVGVCQSI